MSTLKADIDQFISNRSESDLKIAIGELAKKILPKNGDRIGIPTFKTTKTKRLQCY